MNKIWYFVLFIAAGFVLTGTVISLALVRNRIDSQVYGSNFRPIRGEIKTDLYPRHDYINIVITALKNPGLESSGEYLMEIRNDSGDVIRQMGFNGFNVGDPSDLKFQFDPVEASKDTRLTLVIRENNGLNNSILVDTNDTGEIAYKLYYRNLNKKTLIADLSAEWIDRIKSNFLFFILWTGVLTAVAWYGLKNEKN